MEYSTSFKVKWTEKNSLKGLFCVKKYMKRHDILLKSMDYKTSAKSTFYN